MRKKTLAILIFSLLLCGCMKQGNNDAAETTSATSETSETMADQTSVTEMTEVTGSETAAPLLFQAVGLSEIGSAEQTALADVLSASGIDIDMNSPDRLEIKDIDGHLIAFVKQQYPGYEGSDCQYSYLYELGNANARQLEVSGRFGSFTDLGGGVFSAVKFDRDKSPDDFSLTWKNYWFYFEDGEFREYTGEKITKADFMQYTGGKAVLDDITATGGEVTDILYRENGIVNVNYTVTENDVLYNKFLTYDVSGGECKEIRSVYDSEENNYGVYLSSVLNPYTDEELALHEVIKKSAGDIPDKEILNTLFGDLDGDGINELIAVYGEPVMDDTIYGRAAGQLWFASGDTAYQLGNPVCWFMPRIMVSAGQVIVNAEQIQAAGSGWADTATHSFLIKSSSASEIESPYPSGLTLDGKYGDLIADGTGGKYSFYFLDGKISEYLGKEITAEEFLKYQGGSDVLKNITDKDLEVRSIFKRGNGIINISYGAKKELIGTEGYGESFGSVTVRYRNGKVFAPEESNAGVYLPVSAESDKKEQSDFEKFSEMIYDTAEGDESSVLLERFFGDASDDGKNELYAYYGTEDSYELWYADEKGAEKCEKGYELLTLDGDILLKKPRSQQKPDTIDYYIMRDGKPVRLNAFNAKNMMQISGNDFSGYITAADAFSDKSEETSKEYWFYYRNGDFNEYGARSITEEEFAEYKGARAFLDEISSMGGDVTGIILRDNGIININYDAHMQENTQHYYLTLRIDDKDRTEDITPRNEDGTLNNKGYYLLSLKN